MKAHHRPVDKRIQLGRVTGRCRVDLDQMRSAAGVEEDVVAKEAVAVVAGPDLGSWQFLWFSDTRRFWLHLVQLGVEVGSHRLGVVELLRVVAVASERGEPAQDALHNDVLDLRNRINFEYERVSLHWRGPHVRHS